MMTKNASSADYTHAGVAIAGLHHNSIMSHGSHEHCQTTASLLCLVSGDTQVSFICAAHVMLAGQLCMMPH